MTSRECLTSVFQDDQSVRSGRSGRSGRSTVRSGTSSKSRPKSLKKMPLNAEITRHSAGRASRSAEYGVVIKDIGKLAQSDTSVAGQPSPQYPQNGTMRSEPRYVTAPARHAPAERPYIADSRAVFVADDGGYYNAGMTSQPGVPMQLLDMGQAYQVVNQPLHQQPIIMM